MFDRLAENAEVRKQKWLPQCPVFGIVDLDDQKLPGQHQQKGEDRAADQGQSSGPGDQQHPAVHQHGEKWSMHAGAAWTGELV